MTVSQTRALRAALCAATGAVSLIASCTAFAADITAKEPAAAIRGPLLTIGPVSISAPIWVMRGGTRTGPRARSTPRKPSPAARLILLSPSILSGNPEASSAGLKSATITSSPAASSSALEADASGPSFQTPDGISIGGFHEPCLAIRTRKLSPRRFSSPARCGPASDMRPGTGSSMERAVLPGPTTKLTLTQLESGLSEQKDLLRWGWAAGAGVETPILPHWTGRLEYLYTGYNASGVTFPVSAQRFQSDFSLSEVRLGLNYKFEDDAPGSAKDPKTPTSLLNPDDVNFHSQFTATWQGYPAIRSPYQGPNSLPGGGEAREVMDATLFAGFRLWQGAELWVDPEIDQGFGIGDTHGLAGYANGESYKLGFGTPYARVQRYFVRQTIDLGGESKRLRPTSISSPAPNLQSPCADRRQVLRRRYFRHEQICEQREDRFYELVAHQCRHLRLCGRRLGYTLRCGRRVVHGTLDVARGVFDLSATPAGGDSPNSYGSTATFNQLEYVGEIEERHELMGQPGKVKVTGFVVGRQASSRTPSLLPGRPANPPKSSRAQHLQSGPA